MVQPLSFVERFHITAKGRDLPDQFLSAVVDITVDQNLYLPNTLTMTLYDGPSGQTPSPFNLNDSADALQIGDDLIVAVGQGSQDPQQVFDGEIVSRDLDVPYGGSPRLVVRAYDRRHRLQRGRHTRSFLQMTDADIAQKIAQEVGLTAQVDSTAGVYDYVLQNNQTDLEFLHERANRIGYEVYVEGKNLHFRKPALDDNPVAELEWGAEMLRINVHETSVGQVQDVTVRAWDPKQKRPVVGQASTAATTARGGKLKSGKDLAALFAGAGSDGGAKLTVTGRPSADQSDAGRLAQALLDDLQGNVVRVEGEVLGKPAVQPGAVVKLKALGDRYSAQYYVTAARHRVGTGHNYTTTFTLSGRRSGSLLEWLSSARTGGQGNGHGMGGGLVVGTVSSVKDPENMGRVKVKLPWLPNPEASSTDGMQETDWARVATPSGGNGRGFYWLPEVDDEVLVAFEHGDTARAFVVGALWNGQDKPPKGNQDVVDSGSGKINQRILKSRSGHTITLDDTEGKEKISVEDKSGKNVITIDTQNNKITLSSDGDLELTARGDITVSAGKGVSVDAKQDCTLKATGNAKLGGNAVSVEAQSNCDIKANANATITANASAKLSGNATTNVESSGVCSVKGSLLKLN